MLPSEYPEVRDRPALRELLRIQVDMQLVDLRTLLCLPRFDDGLDGGCNLTATMLAANIIAGASVLFWQSGVEALKPGRDRGERFKSLMEAHYPWMPDDAVDAELGARILWDRTRAPLTHTLGIGKQAHLFPGLPKDERGVWLTKFEHGLDVEVASRLMSSYERPDGLGATVSQEVGGYAVSVPSLAWGTTRLLRGVLGDHTEAPAAEATARALLQM